MSEYAIEMLGITKRFPGIIANDNITLQLKKGERADLKGNLNAANAAYEKALRNNGKEVTDRASSIQQILDSRQAVEDAEEALQDHDKHVQWLKEAQEVIGVAEEQ